MNELEWHRQLRELRQPIAPSRDLWGPIEAALAARETPAAPPAPPRADWRPWAQAAALAIAFLLTGLLGVRLHQPSATANTALADARWKPTDPRLAGAAIELDAANLELRLALRQIPGSPMLQRLLARTHQQQSQLRQLSHEAG